VSQSHSSSTHPHAGLSPKLMCGSQPRRHLTNQLEYSQRRSPMSFLTATRLVEACKNEDVICGSFPCATAARTIARNCFFVKSRRCQGGDRNFHGCSPMRQILYAQSPFSAVALQGDSCGPLSPKA